MPKKLELVSIFNAISTLTNFEIQKYYQKKARFNDVRLRNNLPKTKDGA